MTCASPSALIQSMARGEIIAMVTMALMLFGLSALVNGANAENLFPTYPDDGNIEEEARYGVISLTGATSNSTLNLSGIVLLGMSLSAAVCIWAYTHNLLDSTSRGRSHLLKLSPSTSSLNYTLNLSGLLVLGLGVAAATMFWAHVTTLSDNKIKKLTVMNTPKTTRSLNDDGTESLSVMLSNMHRSFERAQVYEPACRQRIICEIGAGHKMPDTFPEKSFGHSVDSFFGSADAHKALTERLENHKRAKTYLMAWNEGKGGKVCKAAYDQCSMTKGSIEKFIQSSE
ncbi:hypothetical protein DAPPUDRAFT_306722 [Daphnia pulex]|uniref:Uncharacterized protein n=1 Tax=Daphnia pulex TaxID=6669 RepID=E9GY37_DAPPU|nr:hypothetical protein DAPPUDRAFT_306722 [Daphnia pulex]|eukprot:EFX75532.1 hypothetical protein DAPPUDRAFT_306722 [Daphnia pulex]